MCLRLRAMRRPDSGRSTSVLLLTASPGTGVIKKTREFLSLLLKEAVYSQQHPPHVCDNKLHCSLCAASSRPSFPFAPLAGSQGSTCCPVPNSHEPGYSRWAFPGPRAAQLPPCLPARGLLRALSFGTAAPRAPTACSPHPSGLSQHLSHNAELIHMATVFLFSISSQQPVALVC